MSLFSVGIDEVNDMNSIYLCVKVSEILSHPFHQPLPAKPFDTLSFVT